MLTPPQARAGDSVKGSEYLVAGGAVREAVEVLARAGQWRAGLALVRSRSGAGGGIESSCSIQGWLLETPWPATSSPSGPGRVVRMATLLWQPGAFL